MTKNENFNELIEIRNKKTLCFKTLGKFLIKIGPDFNDSHLYQMAHYNIFMASGHFDKFLMSKFKIDINEINAKKLYESETEFIKNSIVRDIEFEDANSYISEWFNLLNEQIKESDEEFKSRHVVFITNHLDEAQWCIDTLYRSGVHNNG